MYVCVRRMYVRVRRMYVCESARMKIMAERPLIIYIYICIYIYHTYIHT